LLQRGIRHRIGQVGVPLAFLAQVWMAALLAAAGARGLLISLGPRGPKLLAVLVLGLYGLVFFAVSLMLKLPEAQSMVGMLGRRFGVK
jgi:putative peptidoglycan lipid II flippase